MSLIVRIALVGVFSAALTAQALAASIVVDGLNGASSTSPDTLSSGSTTSLWNLVGTPAGLTLTTYPPGYATKNEVLQYYVVATGSGGSSSVFSLGELSGSGFGTSPVSVAVSSAGQVSLVDTSQSSRNVNNLTSLQILSVSALPTGVGGQSTAVSVSVPGSTASYNQSQLQSLPFTSVPNVTVTSGSPPVSYTDNYTGVSLSTLLGLSLISTSSILDDIVISQGTDGYQVVLAAAELDPAVGGNPNDILAYADNGSTSAFGSDFPGDGVARLVLPGDLKAGRFDSNVDALELVSATPLPATLPLFVGGLGIVGFLARRKRKAEKPNTIA